MPNGNGSPKGQRNARSNLCAETQPGSKSLTQIKQIEQIKKSFQICVNLCATSPIQAASVSAVTNIFSNLFWLFVGIFCVSGVMHNGVAVC